MALLKFNYGPVANLNDLTKAPIKDGNVYITTDSQEMKVDLAGKRLTISDFVSVTAAELDTVAIHDNLFYYVTDTKTIVKYVGTDAEGKRIWEGINNTDQIAGMNTRLITAEGEIDTLQSDLDTAEGKIEALEGKMGSVTNVADAISTAVAAEAAIARAAEEANAADIDALEAKVATWDAAVQTVTAGTGLTATQTGTEVAIDFDETVTWIFDCGSSVE